jgi:hypothetical protein
MTPVSALVEKIHPENNNKHPKKQLRTYAEIIELNGFRAPVVVSSLSGLVIKGAGMVLAAHAKRWKEVPAQVQMFMTEEEELAHLLADNELARQSKADDQTTAGILARLQSTPRYLIQATGFSNAKIESLLERVKARAAPPAPPGPAPASAASPCPFCGASGAAWSKEASAFQCPSCKALGPRASTAAPALKKWDARKTPPPP